MKINGQTYYLDRCLKFVFVGPRVNNGAFGFLTVEYCPRKDERLCARLEADIKDSPNPQQTDRPGYGGTLRIYNPGEEILQMVANSTVWSNDYIDSQNGSYAAQQLKEKQTKNYYANKLQVFVYAGYYDEEIPRYEIGYNYKTRNLDFVPQTTDDGVLIKGDGDYTKQPVIAAYVNNSYYYRRGDDNILDLYVHDVDMSQQSTKVASFGADEAKGGPAYGTPRSSVVMPKFVTFHETLLYLIKNYGSSYGPAMLNRSNVAGKNDWAKIHYIYNMEGYQKWLSAGRDDMNKSYINPNLEAALEQGPEYNGPNYSNWYSNASDFKTMVKELCDYAATAGMNLRWQVERQANLTDFLIWDANITPQLSTTSSIRENATVTIWNFQNQLQVPTIKGNGSLHAKMFFNRNIKPMGALAFAISDDIGDGATASLSRMGILMRNNGKIIGGLAGQAQNPAIQQVTISGSGSIGAVLQNDKKAKEFGYIFNQAWRVVTVRHVLKTHANDWYTEVHTVPNAVGGYIPKTTAKTANTEEKVAIQ